MAFLAGAWADFRVVPERFLDQGDHVAVLARFTGRGRESGVVIDGRPAATVMTFEDGAAIRVALVVTTRPRRPSSPG